MTLSEVAARCNYLSLDRPDLQYVAKEICWEMSAPTVQAFLKFKRIGHFLFHRPRLVWKFRYQLPTTHIDVYVDVIWAASKRSRNQPVAVVPSLALIVSKHGRRPRRQWQSRQQRPSCTPVCAAAQGVGTHHDEKGLRSRC